MDTSADVLQLIEEAYKTFSKGQRYIADYICNNYDKAVDMTAARLGKIVGVSESTVVRFATELGFKGYPQFQKALGELVKQRLSSVQRISLAYERLSEKMCIRDSPWCRCHDRLWTADCQSCQLSSGSSSTVWYFLCLYWRYVSWI